MKKKQLAPTPEQERSQRLLEIGCQLRQFREEQAIPLERVAAQTRIQMRLLSAIEEGRLEHLPEPIYIQGFIRRFAEALGLDGAEVASAFPTGAVVRPIMPAWRELPAAQLRPIHLYLLYIFLIVFAVNNLSSLMERSATQAAGTSEPYQQLSVQPKSTTAQGGSPSNSQSASVSPAPNQSVVAQPAIAPQTVQSVLPLSNPSKPQKFAFPMGLANLLPFLQSNEQADKAVQVSVTLKSQSWLRVVADGKTEFEGVLPEGTQRTWLATEKLILRAGNAGGVLVAVNNGQAKQLGQPGSVEEITVEAHPTSALLPTTR